MMLLFIFIIALFSFTSLIVSKFSVTVLFIVLLGLSLSSLAFYFTEDLFLLIVMWSAMGYFTSLSLGFSYTRCCSSAFLWLLIIGSISTGLLISGSSSLVYDVDSLGAGFDTTLVDLDMSGSLLIGVSLVLKSLCYPLSYWLVLAMSGYSGVSGLVHSLTVVLGGVYTCVMLVQYEIFGSDVYLWLGLWMLVSLYYHGYCLVVSYSRKLVLGYSTCMTVNLVGFICCFDSSVGLMYGLFQGGVNAVMFCCYSSNSCYLYTCYSMVLIAFPNSLLYGLEHSGFLSLACVIVLIWSMVVYSVAGYSLGNVKYLDSNDSFYSSSVISITFVGLYIFMVLLIWVCSLI